jgi:hypothetical protein
MNFVYLAWPMRVLDTVTLANINVDNFPHSFNVTSWSLRCHRRGAEGLLYLKPCLSLLLLPYLKNSNRVKAGVTAF